MPDVLEDCAVRQHDRVVARRVDFPAAGRLITVCAFRELRRAERLLDCRN